MGIKKFAVLVMALIMCLTAVSAMAANEVQVTIGSTVTQHENLRKAFDHIMDENATGNIEVKLLADSTLEFRELSSSDVYVIAEENQNVTILLNGKKMTVAGDGDHTYTQVDGNLTIKGTGSLRYNIPAGFNVSDGATLRMEMVNCYSRAYPFIVVVEGNKGSTLQFLGGSYDIGATENIGVFDNATVQVSADVIDSLRKNIGMPDDGIELLPSPSLIEVLPSWIQGPIDMPQTGDNTSLLLWGGLLMLAAAGFVASRKVRFN